MIIGLDLDGVLYDWHRPVYNYLKTTKGIPESYEEFWHVFLKYEEDLKYIVTLSDLYDKTIPTKETIDTLNKIDKGGHTIHYITSRPESATLVTERYVNKWYPQSMNLTVTKNGDKPNYIRLYKLDFYVNDRMEENMKLKDICKIILYKQPWNDTENRKLFTCIDSLSEILPFLEYSKLKMGYSWD
jgi:uncharacterized HAD superfamily protein